MAILIDDDAIEYEMILPPHGYVKSLGKAKEYFTKIEEYETCDLIKQIEKQIWIITQKIKSLKDLQNQNII